MCGRYTLKTPVERLSEKFQFPQVVSLKPRYNIAPSQSVAVVRLLPDDTDRKLAMLRSATDFLPGTVIRFTHGDNQRNFWCLVISCGHRCTEPGPDAGGFAPGPRGRTRGAS